MKSITLMTLKRHKREIEDNNNLLVIQDFYERYNLGNPKEIMEKLAIWEKENFKLV